MRMVARILVKILLRLFGRTLESVLEAFCMISLDVLLRVPVNSYKFGKRPSFEYLKLEQTVAPEGIHKITGHVLTQTAAILVAASPRNDTLWAEFM